jgi:hypothetical protein
VEISDCPAAVSSIIPTSNGPLPEGGKAFEGGTESEDLPYVNSPTLSMQGTKATKNNDSIATILPIGRIGMLYR